MAFDAGTVERVRDALDRLGERGFREKHVFGGWGFLYGKNTFVIVWGEGILAKLPRASYASSLARAGIRPFTPGGERPMGTWAVVHAEVIADDPELAEWVALGLQGMREGPAAGSGVSRKATSSTRSNRAAKSAKTPKTPKTPTTAKGAKGAKGAKAAKGAKGVKTAKAAKSATLSTTATPKQKKPAKAKHATPAAKALRKGKPAARRR